jgi:hypothetical protein
VATRLDQYYGRLCGSGWCFENWKVLSSRKLQPTASWDMLLNLAAMWGRLVCYTCQPPYELSETAKAQSSSRTTVLQHFKECWFTTAWEGATWQSCRGTKSDIQSVPMLKAKHNGQDSLDFPSRNAQFCSFFWLEHSLYFLKENSDVFVLLMYKVDVFCFRPWRSESPVCQCPAWQINEAKVEETDRKMIGLWNCRPFGPVQPFECLLRISVCHCRSTVTYLAQFRPKRL